MTPNGPDVHPSPQNPTRRVAVARPEMAARSSRGWSAPDRAPGLRRAAELVERAARLDDDPVNVLRLKRLARDMRMRAQAIELDGELRDGLADAVELMRQDFAPL